MVVAPAFGAAAPDPFRSALYEPHWSSSALRPWPPQPRSPPMAAATPEPADARREPGARRRPPRTRTPPTPAANPDPADGPWESRRPPMSAATSSAAPPEAATSPGGPPTVAAISTAADSEAAGVCARLATAHRKGGGEMWQSAARERPRPRSAQRPRHSRGPPRCDPPIRYWFGEGAGFVAGALVPAVPASDHSSVCAAVLRHPAMFHVKHRADH